jgi:hypothetical protein
LQTLTPVMTTTQSAKTTIFYTPYVGNKVPLYDGTNMVMTTFAELSNVTTASSVGNAGPAAVAASSVYDLFVWSNGGTVTLTRGPVWTSDTVRSAGTALTMVNGILLNAVAITNGPAIQRGTYVGTMRSNGSSQLDWIYGGSNAAALFMVWNTYNRVSVASLTFVTGTWTYNSATNREVNGVSTCEVRFVRGLDEDAIIAIHLHAAGGGVSGTLGAKISIGLDSTTILLVGSGYSENAANSHLTATYQGLAGIGYHFVAALEAINGTGTITFNPSATQAFNASLRA